MVEVYENSGQFTVTMKELVKEFDTPFDLFSELAEYYEAHTLTGVSHSRMARYEILDRFVGEHIPDKLELYRRLMVYDLYLRENLKSRPDFAEDQTPFKEKIRAVSYTHLASMECWITGTMEVFSITQCLLIWKPGRRNRGARIRIC